MDEGMEIGVKEKPIEYIKKKLMEMFEKVAEDIARHGVDSVAIWIEWLEDEPVRMEWKLEAGVCECGEWAYHCDACYDNAYNKGFEDGKRECEMY